MPFHEVLSVGAECEIQNQPERFVHQAVATMSRMQSEADRGGAMPSRSVVDRPTELLIAVDIHGDGPGSGGGGRILLPAGSDMPQELLGVIDPVWARHSREPDHIRVDALFDDRGEIAGSVGAQRHRVAIGEYGYIDRISQCHTLQQTCRRGKSANDFRARSRSRTLCTADAGR